MSSNCCIDVFRTMAYMHNKYGYFWTWWRHKMETFSALLALCAGNSPVPVNSPHKCQWRWALMFPLICVWINDWVNNREAGDLRRHRGHYDVTVTRRIITCTARIQMFELTFWIILTFNNMKMFCCSLSQSNPRPLGMILTDLKMRLVLRKFPTHPNSPMYVGIFCDKTKVHG